MVVGLQDVAAIIAFVAVIATAVKGILEYRRSVTVRRATWLYNLYRDFYAKPDLKEVRDELDSDTGEAKIERIIKKFTDKRKLTCNEDEFLTKFNDYLNFFEFMVYLLKIGALKKEDVKVMFSYYLELLKTKTIQEYLQEYGFENLAGYLKIGEYSEEGD